jgi:hypothetical protein
MTHTPRRGLLLLGAGLLALAACLPAPAVPTQLSIVTWTVSPVPTLVPPTETPVVLTRAPLLPSATPVSTVPPSPTFTATPPALYVEEVVSAEPEVLMALYPACRPQVTRVRAVIRSVYPLTTVTLNWSYEGRLPSGPGIAMQQVARNTWEADLGPFERVSPVRYWIVARDTHANQTLSSEAVLDVLNCEEPPPTETPGPGPTRTPTPIYGEELSVHATGQEISVPSGGIVGITLTWEGGVPPFTIDHVYQPEHGTLIGAGLSWIYQPQAGFHGTDTFTFRVTDGNGQASTGTITLDVQ